MSSRSGGHPRRIVFSFSRMLQGRLEHDPPAPGVDPRHHGPRGRQRIDLPDAAPLHADLGAVVMDRPEVAIVPPGELEGILQGLAAGRGSVPSRPRRPVRPTMADHPLEDVVEEEAEPDALAAALAADLIEPVVPVAGAHQRQPVRPHPLLEHEVDRLQAMPVDGVFRVERKGSKPIPCFPAGSGSKGCSASR